MIGECHKMLMIVICCVKSNLTSQKPILKTDFSTSSMMIKFTVQVHGDMHGLIFETSI